MTASRSSRVVVVGSANVDLVARMSRAPAAGETVLCETYFMAPGGKGANQAVAAARMGAAVSLIACLGDDSFGREARSRFAAEGMDVTHVRLLPDSPTGTAFIWVEDSGENRIVVASGANGRLTPEQVEEAAGAIREAAVLLCQLETPLPAVRRALRIARDAGVTTVLNPAPAAPLDPDLLTLIDILTPNEGEAARIVGVPDGLHDPEWLADRLLETGVRAVCVTLGREGVLLRAADQPALRIPAPRVAVVDTTAAGDTFSGALAALLSRGECLAAAAATAVRAASLACTRPGAQPSIPTVAELCA